MNAMEYAEKANDIFVLSDSFIRIKELIDDDASTIDDITDVILIDPALAGAILKLANSSIFNYPGKIDTISKAVLVLGITEVYSLVIAFFTTEAFKAITVNNEYLDEFWEKSVDCALLIKFLGSSLNIANAERMFILGLLHNLGELIVHQFSPDKVNACNDGELLPWDQQRETLGFTYGECSAELLKQWQLPYSLIAPVRNQDEENFSIINTESQLLYVSKRLVLNQRELKNQHLDGLVTDEQLSILRIEPELLAAGVNYCDLERLGILSLLNPGGAMIY